jgi:hypothetical protein
MPGPDRLAVEPLSDRIREQRPEEEEAEDSGARHAFLEAHAGNYDLLPNPVEAE